MMALPFHGAGRGRFLTWVSDLGVSGPGAPPKGLGKLLCFVEGEEMFLIRWELFRTWRSHPRRVRTLCPGDALLGQELHGEEEFRPRGALRKSGPA